MFQQTSALVTGNLTSAVLSLANPLVLEAGKLSIQNTYVHAFRVVYLCSIPFGILGTICAILSRDIGNFLTSHIDIELEEGAHIKSHADNNGGHIIHHVNSHKVEIDTVIKR
jgi:hypothetical protein